MFVAQIRFWNWSDDTAVSTGELPASGEVYCVAFHPSEAHGNVLASGDTGKTIHIWDWSSKTQTRVLAGHSNRVCCLEFSPHDARILASGSADRSFKLWDWLTGARLHTVSTAKGWVCSVKFHPSIRDVVLSGHGNGDYRVRAWKWTPDNGNVEPVLVQVQVSPTQDGCPRVHAIAIPDDHDRYDTAISGDHAGAVHALTFTALDKPAPPTFAERITTCTAKVAAAQEALRADTTHHTGIVEGAEASLERARAALVVAQTAMQESAATHTAVVEAASLALAESEVCCDGHMPFVLFLFSWFLFWYAR